MNIKSCNRQAHSHNIREKLINEFTKYIARGSVVG
jgi:hypothetical protein